MNVTALVGRAIHCCALGLFLAAGCTANFEALKKRAEAGDADSEYKLGVMYANGENAPQDFHEALRWYRAAAEQENADAELQLGLMYARGNGVSKDMAEATRWFEKSAAHGNAKAKYYISGTK